MEGPTPSRKVLGCLMFSAAICQDVLKGIKTGELVLPGRTLNEEMTKDAVIKPEATNKSDFSM